MEEKVNIGSLNNDSNNMRKCVDANFAENSCENEETTTQPNFEKLSIDQQYKQNLNQNDFRHNSFQCDAGESQLSEKEVIDIDEFLYRSGECGRFQIYLVLQLMLITLPIVYPTLIHYFIGYDPPWKCTGINLTNSSVCWSDDFLLHESDDSRRCRLKREEWEYVYAKTTLVTEYDLVCEDSWLAALSGSIVFVGWGIGSVLMGCVSDIYGRKYVMFPTLFLDLFLLFLHAFIKSIWLLLAVRFIMGIFHAGAALNAFILLVEFIGPNCRVLAANVAGLSWAGAAGLMAMKAYLIDDWRILCIALSAPYFFLVLFSFCFPESARWLNLSGRTDEAERILHKAAQVNKRPVANITIKPGNRSETNRDVSFLDLFNSWKAASIVLTQGFIWLLTGMVYYGLSWAFSDLGGDIYINFLLSMSVEIPMHALAVLCLQILGRKRTALLAYGITCISCIGVAVFSYNRNLEAIRLIIGLTGKSTVTLCFISIYMWSAEIYPTVVRTQGMGFNIITSRSGAAISPFIKILDQIHPSAPFILMAVAMFISFLLCLFLPETIGKPTRETFEDLFNE